jgi:hypothetical protein
MVRTVFYAVAAQDAVKIGAERKRAFKHGTAAFAFLAAGITAVRNAIIVAYGVIGAQLKDGGPGKNTHHPAQRAKIAAPGASAIE